MRFNSAVYCSLGLVALVTAGCTSTRDVRNVASLGIVDATVGAPDPGYVEFMSVSKNIPIPVYQLDSQGNPWALAAVGLNKDDRYDHARHQMPLLENLRVVEPAGTHTFVVERDGQPVAVPVKAGHITPVEVDYELIEAGDAFRVYRMDLRVYPPVPFQREKLASLVSPVRR